MENNNNKSYSKPEPRPPLQSQSKCAKIGCHPLRYCHSLDAIFRTAHKLFVYKTHLKFQNNRFSVKWAGRIVG